MAPQMKEQLEKRKAELQTKGIGISQLFLLDNENRYTILPGHVRRR